MWSKACLANPLQPSCFRASTSRMPCRLSSAFSAGACSPPAPWRRLHGAVALHRLRARRKAFIIKSARAVVTRQSGRGRLRPLRGGYEWLCCGFAAKPRSELFRSVLPSPVSVERQGWPSSRSLSSLSRAVLPRMQMRQGLGP